MKKVICLLALLLTVPAANVVAQFEGKISYTFYDMEDGESAEKSNFTAFFTHNRILIQSGESFNIVGTVGAEGLLIRLDKKDFVFLTGNSSAMAITKAEITSFVNMFGSWSESEKEEFKTSFTVKKTNASKQINGYEARKFIFKSKGENSKGVVWMTDEINIYWGMLAEPWGHSIQFITDKDFPLSLILQEGWVPLKGTFYEDSNVDSRFTAAVEATELSQEMVQLSSNIQVKSLAEYLFDEMRSRQ